MLLYECLGKSDIQSVKLSYFIPIKCLQKLIVEVKFLYRSVYLVSESMEETEEYIIYGYSPNYSEIEEAEIVIHYCELHGTYYR